MGYSKALEKAGCEIIDFQEFGSYQGTWLAFVKYNGETGIVQGSYGSCSGCDSFQAEFDYEDTPTEKNGKYYKTYWVDESDEITKEEYEELLKSAEKKLADFGLSYLSGGLYNKEYYENKIKNLKEDDWFDGEEKEICEWAISRNWDY